LQALQIDMRFNSQPRNLRVRYLERCDRNMGDVCIELLLGTLIVVTFSYRSSISEISRTQKGIFHDALSSFTRRRWGTVLIP